MDHNEILIQLAQAGQNLVPTVRHDTYPLVDPLKYDHSGRSILITGASKGLGRAIALSFAKAGASAIAILARSNLDSLEKEIQQTSSQCGRKQPQVLKLSGVDITNRKMVEDAAQQVAKDLGKLDILINNAGQAEPFALLADSDPDIWWRTFELNTKGTYLVTRSLLPLVLKSIEKTIISISSCAAHLRTPGASAYQCTKLMNLRLNDYLVAEYAQQGIVAYAVEPGNVITELVTKNLPEEVFSYFVDTPELVADSLTFLTAERREWLNDRYVSVTWDMTEFLEKKNEIVSKDLLKVRLRLP